MEKPIIGITPQYDYKNNFVRIQANYLKAIKAAGGIPYLLPLEIDNSDLDQIIKQFDGFLFSGGPDIDPFLFNEETIPEGGIVLPERDKLEEAIFNHAYIHNKPMLGICRGLQAFNIFLGGSIYQDIEAQYFHNPSIGHYQKSADPVKTHSVKIMPDSLLHQIIPKETIKVNSFHHQAIKTLSPRLKTAALSPDSLIEAAYSLTKTFLLGVQWHPEHLYSFDPNQLALFKAFVNACQAR